MPLAKNVRCTPACSVLYKRLLR